MQLSSEFLFIVVVHLLNRSPGGNPILHTAMEGENRQLVFLFFYFKFF